jgi:thiamine pyrophosphokinase
VLHATELLGQLEQLTSNCIRLRYGKGYETGYKSDVLLGDFDRDFDANYYKENNTP